MTDRRLAEIIRELLRELDALDRAMVLMQRMAGSPRGGPGKRPPLVARQQRVPAKR